MSKFKATAEVIILDFYAEKNIDADGFSILARSDQDFSFAKDQPFIHGIQQNDLLIINESLIVRLKDFFLEFKELSGHVDQIMLSVLIGERQENLYLTSLQPINIKSDVFAKRATKVTQ